VLIASKRELILSLAPFKPLKKTADNSVTTVKLPCVAGPNFRNGLLLLDILLGSKNIHPFRLDRCVVQLLELLELTEPILEPGNPTFAREIHHLDPTNNGNSLFAV
jgi:hypothetical protein